MKSNTARSLAAIPVCVGLGRVHGSGRLMAHLQLNKTLRDQQIEDIVAFLDSLSGKALVEEN